MASFNKIILLGNVCQDPELSYSPKGTALMDIPVATNHVWTDETGVRREQATYIDITLWSRLAEIAKQYLKKGLARLYRGPAPA
jgi:single-strand DNA-binding protein